MTSVISFAHFIISFAILIFHKIICYIPRLEIVFTIAGPAFDILFIGCVLNTKIAYATAEKLTFEAFY